MPRELSWEAVAMAPTASNATFSISFKSLLSFVGNHELEVKVIAAWLVWFVLRHLQSILGPMRRRSGHWLVQYGAMAAYYLPTLVVFYTANAVYSSVSDIKIILSIGCCFLLISCARGAVTMTAFNLDHGPTRLESWRLLPWLLYFAWLQWGLVWWDRKISASDVYFILVLGVAPVLYVLLAKPVARGAILDYETKEFADRMMRESSSSPSPFFSRDGNSSSSLYDRCRYPIKLPDGRWINFSDVLQQQGRLTGDYCAVDPDMCLSYSFCRLLARRYFGFPCAEDGNSQVRDLVLTELLADCNGNKAFSIVEVQLALLHDYFFTNYHSRITSGLFSVKQGIVLMMCFILIALSSLVAGHLFSALLSTSLMTPTHIFLYAGLLVLLYTVIKQPQFPVLPTYWHPIRKLFLYYPATTDNTDSSNLISPSVVTERSASSSGTRSQSSGISYWRKKMGQYSVMEDYDRCSYMKAIIAWCKVHVLSQLSYSFIKHHPAEEEDVSVPDSLRMLVARTIKDINGPPTLGMRSLRVNGLDDDLSWTCRQETLTHTILIWHIATCYSDMMSGPLEEEEDMEMPVPQQLEEPGTGYRRLARTLSRYCAYLVAFLPEMLPEHSLTAKFVLQQVLQEAKDLDVLGSTRMSMEDKRSNIQQLELPEDESNLTTFQKGVHLGRQLEQVLEVPLRWKAMADFWAEMILYVASSPDNATAHVQQLAQGGEFVTHLWALLCNAGIIMKRQAEEPATSSRA